MAGDAAGVVDGPLLAGGLAVDGALAVGAAGVGLGLTLGEQAATARSMAAPARAAHCQGAMGRSRCGVEQVTARSWHTIENRARGDAGQPAPPRIDTRPRARPHSAYA